ncbi:hypothetical protein [Lactobacillus psittaci]|uniref:SAM-dependent methyltransferase n=1 Tax=Lactobacillus psittaci DSM 15354 TaxID=1122152 RepID=A0A0R1S3K1_9LACO|nr:hypothetical protein [Lactobacillus psittaci]KRL63639.1 hypothetical protein FC23_GL000548 [Lactobacillus psittaci DSM 15354]
MTDFLTKLIKLDNELNIAELHQQVKQIINTCNLLDQKLIPLKQVPKLGIKVIDNKTKLANNLLNNFRQYLSMHYGLWSLPNLTTAKLIINRYQPNLILEVMAGNAAWSKAFQLAGAQVIATDNLEWAKSSNTGQKQLTHVENLTANAALSKYQNCDLIICSWAPNFGQADVELTSYWRQHSNAKLLVVGEELGATNSAAFWLNETFATSANLKEINQSFTSFDFINEKIFEIER